MNIQQFFTDAQSILTLVSFLTFIGIVLWSYNGRRKSALDEAAYLPFADDEDLNTASTGNHHG